MCLRLDLHLWVMSSRIAAIQWRLEELKKYHISNNPLHSAVCDTAELHVIFQLIIAFTICVIVHIKMYPAERNCMNYYVPIQDN